MLRFTLERFGIELSRRRSLNWLHRLGFAFKRPKKRLLKAVDAKREAFVAEYAALREEAQQTRARIFFADEAHFRADPKLRGKRVLKSKPALVDTTNPRYGEKASYYSAVCLETWRGGTYGTGGEQQLRDLGCLPDATDGKASRADAGHSGTMRRPIVARRCGNICGRSDLTCGCRDAARTSTPMKRSGAGRERRRRAISVWEARERCRKGSATSWPGWPAGETK